MEDNESNFIKASEFIESLNEYDLRQLLNDLMFYNDSDFIENYICFENNL